MLVSEKLCRRSSLKLQREFLFYHESSHKFLKIDDDNNNNTKNLKKNFKKKMEKLQVSAKKIKN